MAYFARIDKDNYVIRVSSVNDAEVPTEQAGKDFLVKHNGGGWYVQTYLDGNPRKTYAATGYYYDRSKDAFIPPKPAAYPSWILNERAHDYLWRPPVAMPADAGPEKAYQWNEATISWDEIV
jgi:hypothetical protein